tara:strand:- start:27 stop:218 length:192 start_codon:yes stop_codon:yes gene_type:complete
MKPEKEELEKRKLELQKQHEDLLAKINQGKEAIRNMETTLIVLKGAIQQCDWTLDLYKKEKTK